MGKNFTKYSSMQRYDEYTEIDKNADKEFVLAVFHFTQAYVNRLLVTAGNQMEDKNYNYYLSVQRAAEYATNNIDKLDFKNIIGIINLLDNSKESALQQAKIDGETASLAFARSLIASEIIKSKEQTK